MPGTIVTLIIAACVLVLMFSSLHVLFGQPNRRSRDQHKADRHINEAEYLMMTGQFDSAAALYNQAVALAVGAPLLMSEAHFGLFRVCKHRRDWQGAALQIDLALSFSPEWRNYKPNFEDLLKREKELLQKRKS